MCYTHKVSLQCECVYAYSDNTYVQSGRYTCHIYKVSYQCEYEYEPSDYKSVKTWHHRFHIYVVSLQCEYGYVFFSRFLTSMSASMNRKVTIP